MSKPNHVLTVIGGVMLIAGLLLVIFGQIDDVVSSVANGLMIFFGFIFVVVGTGASS